MAIIYKFRCLECQYEDDIYIGNTKMEYMKGLPQHILGSCMECGKLFNNTKRICRYCNKAESLVDINTFYRIKTYFSNKHRLPTHVKFYNEDHLKKVPCPKCSNKYLTTYPMFFID